MSSLIRLTNNSPVATKPSNLTFISPLYIQYLQKGSLLDLIDKQISKITFKKSVLRGKVAKLKLKISDSILFTF